MSFEAIPIQIGAASYSVVVILNEESIDRIKARDPLELVTRMLGEPWASMRLQDVVMTFADASDKPVIEQLLKNGDLGELLKYVTRGYTYRPDRADGAEYEKRTYLDFNHE